MFMEQSSQQADRSGERAVEVYRPKLDGLPPRKHQQLGSHGRGSLCECFQIAQRGPNGLWEPTLRSQTLQVQHHDLQDVVEVMCHSPRKLANDLHLLRLPKLGF